MGRTGVPGTRNKCWDHALASHAEHEELVMGKRSRECAERHSIFQYIFCWWPCRHQLFTLYLMLFRRGHFSFCGHSKIQNYIIALFKPFTPLVTRGRKNTCLSLSLNQTLEVLAKSVVRGKHREIYVGILTLICAAYVVWEGPGKKVSQFFLVKHD